MKHLLINALKILLTGLIIIFGLVGIVATNDDNPASGRTQSTTDITNLISNAEPPYVWYPFTEPELPDERFIPLIAANYEGQLPYGTNINCTAAVVDPPGIDFRDTGNIVGALSYNNFQRGNGNSTSASGGNTTLGPFRDDVSVMATQIGYKYQVEVTFSGPLEECFFGQMASQWIDIADTNMDVEFHADGPANDWIGKKWLLDTSAGEKKSDFPVIEVVGNTIRYIDAPGGTAFAADGKKKFLLIYAGTCGIVTHTRILEVHYPTGAMPTAHLNTELEFLGKVNNITYQVE